MFSAFSMPVILNKCMLPAVLHSFIGIKFCTSDTDTIIFTALENVLSLQIFDFL